MTNRHEILAKAPKLEEHTRGFELNLTHGPVDLEVGNTRLKIIDPHRDLSPLELEKWRNVNTSIGFFVIEPAILDPENMTGLKGLRDGETLILGRHHTYDNRFRFDKFASRKHLQITRHGEIVSIWDLGSANETFIGQTVLNRAGIAKPALAETMLANDNEKFRVSIEAASLTHEGHPDRNDDSYFINESGGGAGVFDGVGSNSGSDLASQIAANSIDKAFRNHPGLATVNSAVQFMHKALHNAHRDIVQGIGETTGDFQPATTATVVKTFEDEEYRHYAVIASVGDSRAYLFRDGNLRMLTLDQSMALATATTRDEKYARQWRFSNITKLEDLTPEEQVAYKQQNMIYGALGPGGNFSSTQVEVVYLEPGDQIILTSDGIHDNLTSEEITEILRHGGGSLELTHRAQERSREDKMINMRAKQDDMTAVVMRFDAKNN